MNDKEAMTEVLGALAESQRNLTKAQAMLTVAAQSLMADVPRVQQPSEENGCCTRRYLGRDQEASAKTKTKFIIISGVESRREEYLKKTLIMERKSHKRLKRSYTLEEAISAITDDCNPVYADTATV